MTAHEHVLTGYDYLWDYRGIDEPSMRKIYEFDGQRWFSWENRLPVPVQNNTVIHVDSDELCEKGSLMTEEQFVNKGSLKPDKTLPMWTYSRCGDGEVELGVGPFYWWDNRNHPLENLKCFSHLWTHIQTFQGTETFCKYVGYFFI